MSENECCGCRACGTVCPVHAISFQEDPTGFYYPHIDETICINCGRCIQICPLRTAPQLGDAHSQPQFYAGYNLCAKIRQASTSGGCFTALAEAVLKENGVVVGAAFSRSGITHICVKGAELEKLRGSKYAESRIEIWSEIVGHLKNGKKVLFSGTPCQVAAAKNLLVRWKEQVVFVETVCFGIPSGLLFQRYLDWKEKTQTGTGTVDFSFRDKDQMGYTSKLKHSTSQGTFFYDAGQDPYLKAFYRRLSLRPCCYTCKFKGFPRVADITLGDFWGIETIFPDMNPAKGVSLIIANSNKGQQLLSAKERYLILKKTDKDAATAKNPMIETSASMPEERVDFWKDFQQIKLQKLFVKYKLMPCRRQKIYYSLRRFLSTIWHKIK